MCSNTRPLPYRFLKVPPKFMKLPHEGPRYTRSVMLSKCALQTKTTAAAYRLLVAQEGSILFQSSTRAKWEKCPRHKDHLGKNSLKAEPGGRNNCVATIQNIYRNIDGRDPDETVT